jgi:dTDP-4-amino-4,6-dideoxygalactose transaminase
MLEKIQLARPWFDERENEAVRRVLASGWVVQGPEVEAFEAEIARLHQVRHCVAASSGTAALHLCYLTLGIGPDDAVFIPSFAWPSAANMAKLVGAKPIFVDVLPDTYNIDAEDLERRIRECIRRGWGRPTAVVPVHEFGLAAEMDKILPIAVHHSLKVIEDAACAFGATYKGRPVGNFGTMAVLSFHPRKSITTGEGGAVLTNDHELAERCRLWRNHGQRVKNGQRDFVLPGLNYRLTDIQAAIGRIQLAKFPGILEKRRFLASEYFRLLSGHSGVELPLDVPEQTWQTFMVVLGEEPNRDGVIAGMASQGVEAAPGSVAAHLGNHFHTEADLPSASRLHRYGVALPLYPGLEPGLVPRIVTALCSNLA